jgi:hypothetical protein
MSFFAGPNFELGFDPAKGGIGPVFFAYKAMLSPTP